MIYYKKNFADLISQMQILSSHGKTKIKDNLISAAMKFYTAFTFFGIIIYLSQPLLPSHPLILECWIPNKFYINFFSLYLIEMYLIFFFVNSTIAFDILLMSFCEAAVTQFKLLNETFSLIDFERFNVEGKKKLVVKCILYHNFLTK